MSTHAEGAGGRRATSWLPPGAATPPMKGKPWRPSAIHRLSTRKMRYVVVDEIFADLAELSVSEWPVVDASGRLRFMGEETVHVEVDAERMRLFLRRHRMPRKRVSRELRVGDTFGVEVEPGRLDAFVSQLAEEPPTTASERRRTLDPATWDWIRPPVFDVTADAREGAKLAYYAAVTGPLPEGTGDAS
jgi:hypothetical protein